MKVFAWFWPFAATPSDQSGAHFEVNGFEGKPNENSGSHVTDTDF